MSIKAVDWALREAPINDPLAKLVLVGIANHATDEGTNAYPSRKTLAVYASCSVRTVQNKLNHLVSLGIIKQGDQEIVSHFRGDRKPVVYDINYDVQILHPVDGVNEAHDVQDMHPVDEPRGAADDTTGCSSRHNDVQLSAHKPSLEPSYKPSMDDGAAVGHIHLVSVSEDGTSAVFRHNGKLYVGVDPASSPKIADGVGARDGQVGPPALTLAPGLELPKRNGWRPGEKAMATARSTVTITDIDLHIVRYEILKADKKQQPSDSEWLRWLIQDERQARAEAAKQQQESRQSRSWHDVAD